MQTVDAAGLPIGDGHPPRIMGVLNVSAESPYDPSVFADADAAAAYVESDLTGEGADIVDVGLETANKRFEVLSAEEELERLETAFAVRDRVDADVVWSIETRYHEVAEAALEGGFDVVNDVCGFADPQLPAVCEAHDAAVVKMASPPDLKRPGALSSVEDIYEALERGPLTEKTIVDPAFGGWSEDKTLADDRETFHRLREFRALDRPVLVSINRKNFLRDVAGRSTDAALPVSLAATAMAVERGAHVLRTHDVAETRDAALVGDTFGPRRAAGDGVEELDVRGPEELRRHLESVGGDRRRAVEGVSRAFRVRNLDADALDAMAAAGSRAGALVEGGPRTAVVAGTDADLRAFCRAVETDVPRVADAVGDTLQ